MEETGDSWSSKATSGDLKLWKPGGSKQHEAYLGVGWPGYGKGKKKRA